MQEMVASKVSELECCPVLNRAEICDTLNFRYRVPYRVRVGNQREPIKMEVVLHYRLERCSGPLVLGDPVYSTTLLPGEEVRLFTSDRHSRWSYDTESQLAYRHETTSEESFYTAAMSRSLSDLTVSESGAVSSSYEESWAEGGGGASLNLGIIQIGGGGGGGSYDASSTMSFARNLSQHAEASSSYVASGVRAKSSTAIGEVQSRTHAEGQSEDHFESASRVFRNPNRCHAVTYLFHKINKVQKIRFRLVAIQRYVDDPAAPVGAYQRPPVDVSGRVMVMPQAIGAASAKRLEVEDMARTSALQRLHLAQGEVAGGLMARASFSAAAVVAQPIPANVRTAALAQLDKELVAAGLLDPKTGRPSEKIIAELSWEREEILPTPGVLVKGCLDNCCTCEPALEKRIELELERMRLENEKLKREIELLDKAQEYRCCPVGEEEPEPA
ncbi:MAG: hypothetical protein AB1810_05630 [Pseudomonadota bacterium]